MTEDKKENINTNEEQVSKSDKEKEFYKIELNKEQVLMLIKALDFFSRIGIGQLAEINQLYVHYTKWAEHDHVYLLDPYKKAIGFSDLYSFYAIGSEKVHSIFQDCYDMIKTMQKRIAADDDHHKYSVWHDGNMLKLGKEPIIKIEKIKND